MQQFAAPAPALCRLSILRTSVKGDRWTDGITWDDLQRLKFEAGYGDAWAVELFPADAEVVNVANIVRYVVNAAEPFIVNTRNGERAGQQPRTRGVHEPLWTVTAQGSQGAMVAPAIVRIGQTGGNGSYSNSVEQPLTTVTSKAEHLLVAPALVTNTTGHPGARADEPLRTVTTGGHHALVSAFIAKHYGDSGQRPGSDAREPLATVTACDHNSLVAANLVHMGHGEQNAAGAQRWSHGVRDVRAPLNTVTASGVPAGIVTSSIAKLRGGGNIGQPTDEPLRTISAGGQHFAEVRAFLTAYYGTDQDPDLRDPLHTVTTRDRYALVTVAGQQYAIADIGLRMLAPVELFRAQGFPASYVIEHGIDERGQRIDLTKTAQVRMCGNSVCPPLAAALVRANLGELAIRRAA